MSMSLANIGRRPPPLALEFVIVMKSGGKVFRDRVRTRAAGGLRWCRRNLDQVISENLSIVGSDGKLDPVARFQTGDFSRLKFFRLNENVIAPVGWGKETVALDRIEPLHCPEWQGLSPGSNRLV
jgi:hypothetical protein